MIHVYFTELPETLTKILGLKYDDSMTYEERVKKRYDYVKEQYELSNKYEGWDYLEHVKYGLEFKHLVLFRYLISTKGRILTLFPQKGKYRTLSGDVNRYGYKYNTLATDQGVIACRLNRVVCSTFIPKPEHYTQGLNDLVVNHKDLIKTNNHFNNFEWCTVKENSHHYYMEQDSKTIYFNGLFEATVEVDCRYKGTKFKIIGSEGLREIGLASNALTHVFTQGGKCAFGCTWRFITQEEAEALPDLPEFIKDKFLNDRKYLNHHIKPLKGMVVKDCEYKGLEFTIYGTTELASFGFNQGSTSVSILTGDLHQGCKWEYISRDEAETLPRGLTKEQQNVIITKRNTNKV